MFWKRHPLIAGAFTLFASGIVIRIVSTIYRIALVRIAGEDVLGLFQLTLPLYHLGWTLATAGLHVAVNQLSADALGRREYARAYRLRNVGVRLTIVIAFVISLLLSLGNKPLATLVLADPRARLPLAMMGFLLFPAALSATYRGILQGQQRMGPIASSTALEVILRSPVVLLAVSIVLPLGIAWGASGIIFGLTIGEIASLAFLVWAARKAMKDPLKPIQVRSPLSFASTDFIPYARRLLRLGIPVMMSGTLNNLLSIFSVAIIPRRLGLAGLAMDEAIRAYGRLAGMAIPILYMPMVIISPIVKVLEPAVADRRARRGAQAIRPLIQKAYTAAVLVSVVAVFGFLWAPEWLGNILYNVSGLGQLIRPLAIAAPFAYIGSVTSGTLYGLGRTGTVMINSAAGNVVRLILIWHLAAQPTWGILGVTWGIVADYAISTTLNLFSLWRISRR